MSVFSQLIRAVVPRETCDTGVVFALLLGNDSGWFADIGSWRKVARLEDAIREKLAETGLGDLDWHDVILDGLELRIFVCGRDPDALFEALYPVIARNGVAPEGSYALIRYGARGPASRIAL